MWPESPETSPETIAPLRSGLTTGSCATACCVAAAEILLNPHASLQVGDAVSILLPRGQTVELVLSDLTRQASSAQAATVKDAGDDPDVTHGATVFARVDLVDSPGVSFVAGPGVGTVTRSGLLLPVGEPAINPVPRQMIGEHLRELAHRHRYQGGFRVTVGVEKGEQIALKTMNPRLGIVGGLSILGTTGIVRPFSCSAYIASIHQGIDVALANGVSHMAATTGSTSEAAIRAHYGLADMALLEMGDFVGAVLKYQKQAPLRHLSLCGGFAKISKLAAGHMDLHSSRSQVAPDFLAQQVAAISADSELVAAVATAPTALAALRLCQAAGVDLAQAICRRALQVARGRVPAQVAVEVWATDREGNLLARAASHNWLLGQTDCPPETYEGA